MCTYSPKSGDADKKWYVTDATDVVLGRLVAQIAALLRGKYKSMFVPYMNTGDYVIIINAGKAALTSKKLDQKMAYRYSGRPGGLTVTAHRGLLAATLERAIEKAVKGMPPHNSLDHTQFKELHAYAGPEYPHAGQSSAPYELTRVAQ